MLLFDAARSSRAGLFPPALGDAVLADRKWAGLHHGGDSASDNEKGGWGCGKRWSWSWGQHY